MHQAPKPGNFAAIRLNRRIEEAKAADPEAQPTEIQDMMMGEIRKHYRALLEKRGASMPLSEAIIEDAIFSAPSLSSDNVDTATGEIFAYGLAEGGTGDVQNLLANAGELSTPEPADLEPELGFMVELSEMLADTRSNKSTSRENSNDQ